MDRKVLILGASGMMGHALFAGLASASEKDCVKGTMRNRAVLAHPMFKGWEDQIYCGVDVFDFDSFLRVFAAFRPDVVINCIGIVKQLIASKDPIPAITFNAVFPHRIAELCGAMDVRLIHFTTDCVFKGDRGNYDESDPSDAEDLYGRTKFLGEIAHRQNCLTLRTSYIGHELFTHHGLVDWFLSQTGKIRGFAKAMFSGLPTVEIVRVLRDFVLPFPDLSGLYHLSAKSISKYDLLRLVAATYQKQTTIEKDEDFAVDRSLNSHKFMGATGYQAPEWSELVTTMHANRHIEGVE